MTLPYELIMDFRSKDIASRTVDELIGIARGLIADGVVNGQEAEFLVGWLKKNAQLTDSWVVQKLNARVCAMLEDGIIDAQERKELFAVLSALAGERNAPDTVLSFSTSLPLDQPQPALIFPDRNYCFTGQFAFGPRCACSQEVESRGGVVIKGITKRLDVLVVGSIGSEAWKHTSFGRKIEKAVEYRDNGGIPIAIVSEDHWASFLG